MTFVPVAMQAVSYIHQQKYEEAESSLQEALSKVNTHLGSSLSNPSALWHIAILVATPFNLSSNQNALFSVYYAT